MTMDDFLKLEYGSVVISKSNPERPKEVYMSLSKSFINFSAASLKTALGVVPASLQAFLNASASGIFILQPSTV